MYSGLLGTGSDEGKSVNPALGLGSALLPVVERAVLEVALGLVGEHGEGGAGHSECVAVEQRGVAAHWFEQPVQQIVEAGNEPQETHRHANLPEVEG